MSMAGKMYFDALSKIGENAAGSLVSKDLGKFLCCSPLGLTGKIFTQWRSFSIYIALYL